MTGCPGSGAAGTVKTTGAGLAGAASAVQTPAGGAARLRELRSGAGRAFQPERHQPRHTTLELAAMPSAVPCARLHARNVVAEWGMSDLADTTELLVSELVTNAITELGKVAWPGSRVVSMRLTAGTGTVLIEVHDSSPRTPERQNAQDDWDHGRGLTLVDTLSIRWDTCPIPGNGKIVWCIAGLNEDLA